MPKIPGLGDVEFSQEQVDANRSALTSYQPEQLKAQVQAAVGALMPNLDFSKKFSEVMPQVMAEMKKLSESGTAQTAQLAQAIEFMKSNGLNPEDMQTEQKPFDQEAWKKQFQEDAAKKQAETDATRHRDSYLDKINSMAIAKGMDETLSPGFLAQLATQFGLQNNQKDAASIEVRSLIDNAEGNIYMNKENKPGGQAEILAHMQDKFGSVFWPKAPGGFPTGDTSGVKSKDFKNDPKAPLSAEQLMEEGGKQWLENHEPTKNPVY